MFLQRPFADNYLAELIDDCDSILFLIFVIFINGFLGPKGNF